MRFFRKLKRVLDTPIAMSMGRALTAILSLVTAPIIAQAIGTEGRGLTGAALAAVQITGIAIGMGVPLAVRRRSVDADPATLASLVKTARLFGWLTVLPALGIGVLCHLFFFGELSTTDSAMFLVAMASSCLTVLWTTDLNVFVAERRYFRMVCLVSIQSVAYFIGVMIFWLTGHLTVGTVLLCFAAGTVAAFVLGRSWMSVRGGQIREFWSVVREGFTMWGSQLAEMASYRLDQLLVLPVIGASATGIYSVASTIGMLPFSLAVALGASVFQSFARTKDKALISGAIRQITVIVVVVALGLALVSIWLIPGLFGEDFRDSVVVSWITLFGCVFIAMNYIAVSALIAQRRGKAMTAMQVVGLAIGIGLMYPMGSAFGAQGAAWAAVIGYATTFALALVSLRIPPLDIVPRPRDLPLAVRAFLQRGSS
ncbi:oligosaccharide flippase family protein [Pseudoclavibacter helvolus]|uniref:oligosaccharide flippase family protein n=1 Tax=Pseudoclavibacter helvolus TaxID=255205 RepID=UPI003C73E181